MAEITLTHEINTDEDTFWSKIVLDEAFNRKLFLEGLRFPGWKLVSSRDDGTKIERTVQVDPPVGDLPGPLKKVIGDRLSYTEYGTFDKAAKRYAFRVTPSTLADKTKVSGELWTEPLGDKKVRRHCRLSVEVKVFMVGSMVEERIMADLRSSYDTSSLATNKIIAEGGL